MRRAFTSYIEKLDNSPKEHKREGRRDKTMSSFTTYSNSRDTFPSHSPANSAPFLLHLLHPRKATIPPSHIKETKIRKIPTRRKRNEYKMGN